MAKQSSSLMRKFVWPALGAIAILTALVFFGTAAWRNVREATHASIFPEQPVPPPISDKIPGAPGPDNNVQSLTPPEGVSPQPPSPIDSQHVPPPK